MPTQDKTDDWRVGQNGQGTQHILYSNAL